MLDAHDLPNDVDHLKRLVLEHRSRVQAQQLEIERLKIQLSRLRRWKFGRSSEQLDLQIAQIELTLQVLQVVTSPPAVAVAAPAANDNTSPVRERRPPVRRALPAHLPRETVVHVSPSARQCAMPAPAHSVAESFASSARMWRRCASLARLSRRRSLGCLFRAQRSV